jgi:hypothetical protein
MSNFQAMHRVRLPFLLTLQQMHMQDKVERQKENTEMLKWYM